VTPCSGDDDNAFFSVAAGRAVLVGLWLPSATVSSYAGVDRDRVLAELQHYVNTTQPRPMGGSGAASIVEVPNCGRDVAVDLSERVRPILDVLYPNWRDENPTSPYFEFKQDREACKRLRARILSEEEISSMLGGLDASPRLAANQLHDLIWRAASPQWATSHRQEAVLAAAKEVNSILQTKLGRRDLSEYKLVTEAFSEKAPAPGKPRLRFSIIEDDQTRESIRQGVMSFGVGCFRAIRNPVGHLRNEEHELTEQEALERLAALSLLARWIEQADVVPSQDGP
jgi:hypothetical protein